MNMELDREQRQFDIKKISLKYYYNQRLWNLGQNTEIATSF